ncbi:uncharacterized protein Tco025E_08429 [Trypanosoma conorhini]|uniref:Galactose oxidase n=1 Tax=Trypanosoma conorhini TaxID=83891 RepID=A0A3R7MA65_9TRYP|nr:uncharacterized protein Tco025E_08429 [Trypanosoma conorhini]RNF02213.1 hypothetical protein Tco025E_08429 [Trypanosoma conorhini]
MNTAVPPLCDGVSFTLCDDDVYAFGGAVPEIIWRLHLVTRTWYETPCTGVVPDPRKGHAAVSFAGNLLICGGEPLQPSSLQPPRLMPYYELSLDTLNWTLIDTFGAVPLNRSHHSCSIVGESMILLGGKPVLPTDDGAVTNERMSGFVRAGFYDVHILDIVSRAWRSVVAVGPAPQLWGHSAAVYAQKYILFFGGVDVATNDTTAISGYGNPHHRHDPPVAKVSDKLYLLDVEQMVTRVISPAVHYSTLPRAFHAAHVNGSKMYVLGGLNIDKNGKVAVLDDLWVYDVIEGKWNVLEVPMQLPAAVRRLSFVYDSQIVVVPSTTSMWYLDVHEKSVVKAWKEVPTSHVTVAALPATSEAEEYNEFFNPRRSSVCDDAPHAEEMAAAQSVLPPATPKTPPMMPTARMDMLMDEIHQLRELILAHHSPQPPAPQQQKSEENPPPATAKDCFSPSREKSGSAKTRERRIREKERLKELARQKEQILQLTQRLEKLLALQRASKQEEPPLPLAMEQQPPRQAPSEALKDPPIREVAECSERDVSMPSSQPSQGDASRPPQGNGVDTNATASRSSHDATSGRWTELIGILKNSPSSSPSKAFQASVVIL